MLLFVLIKLRYLSWWTG